MQVPSEFSEKTVPASLILARNTIRRDGENALSTSQPPTLNIRFSTIENDYGGLLQLLVRTGNSPFATAQIDDPLSGTTKEIPIFETPEAASLRREFSKNGVVPIKLGGEDCLQFVYRDEAGSEVEAADRIAIVATKLGEFFHRPDWTDHEIIAAPMSPDNFDRVLSSVRGKSQREAQLLKVTEQSFNDATPTLSAQIQTATVESRYKSFTDLMRLIHFWPFQAQTTQENAVPVKNAVPAVASTRNGPPTQRLIPGGTAVTSAESQNTEVEREKVSVFDPTSGASREDVNRALLWMGNTGFIPLSVDPEDLSAPYVFGVRISGDGDSLDLSQIFDGFNSQFLVAAKRVLDPTFQQVGTEPNYKNSVFVPLPESLFEIALQGLSNPQARRDFLKILDQAHKDGVETYLKIIDAAESQRASDVHIEMENGVPSIRYRIDGVLCQAPFGVSAATCQSILGSIMSDSVRDAHNKRVHQDGAISFREYGADVGKNKQEEERKYPLIASLARRGISLRISYLKTDRGFSLVVRIHRTAHKPSLDRLGLQPQNKELLERFIEFPNGLIIVTGPTGSGKSTACYGMLDRLNVPSRKILAAEDPVECPLRGVQQVSMNDRGNITYLSTLKAGLRQDPETLLIGELREPEETGIAIQASKTGHLVFTTLHTNDAFGVIPRLRDLGVTSTDLAECLRLIVAQRLVAKFRCEEDAETFRPDPYLIERYDAREEFNSLMGGEYIDFPVMIHRTKASVGAEDGNGYFGRLPVMEMIRIAPKQVELFYKDDWIMNHHMEAVESDPNAVYRPMVLDGLHWVVSGQTSLSELKDEVPPGQWLLHREKIIDYLQAHRSEIS